jgi:hypothetical protein
VVSVALRHVVPFRRARRARGRFAELVGWSALVGAWSGPVAAQPAEAGPVPPSAPVSDPLLEEEAPRPPPLHVEYAQYGVAIATELSLDSGALCPSDATNPCIVGSGGGLAIRGGYRSPGPWYYGGAYEFIKMDSGNLYRLGIFQQLRAEMRYHPDLGYRTAPYATWGLGAVAYGNEGGVETGGALIFGGGGVEFEVSRFAVVGLGVVYRPALLAGWTDTAGQVREAGLVQFIGLEFMLEVRSELGRE